MNLLFWSTHQVVQMEPFSLLVARLLMKEEWRSASMGFGGLCVTTPGEPSMLGLSANS